MIGILSILGSLIYLYHDLHFIYKILKVGFNIFKIAVQNTTYTTGLLIFAIIFSIFLNLLLLVSAIGLLRLSEIARRIMVICLIIGLFWEILEFVIEKRIILEDFAQYIYIIFSLGVLINKKVKRVFIIEGKKIKENYT